MSTASRNRCTNTNQTLPNVPISARRRSNVAKISARPAVAVATPKARRNTKLKKHTKTSKVLNNERTNGEMAADNNAILGSSNMATEPVSQNLPVQCSHALSAPNPLIRQLATTSLSQRPQYRPYHRDTNGFIRSSLRENSENTPARHCFRSSVAPPTRTQVVSIQEPIYQYASDILSAFMYPTSPGGESDTSMDDALQASFTSYMNSQPQACGLSTEELQALSKACAFIGDIVAKDAAEASRDVGSLPLIAIQPGVTCRICLEHYHAGDEVVTLPCSHEHHYDCIALWLKQNANCPLCRTNVRRNGTSS